jgi:hypothetical protein
VLPSISNWPRTRADFNAQVRREIVTDFTVNFSGYTSYDSEPPTEGAAKNDYGVVLSVGWTF